jgi:hypothetical protein
VVVVSEVVVDVVSVVAGVPDPPRPRITRATTRAITMIAMTIPMSAQSRVERPEEEVVPPPVLVNTTVTLSGWPVRVTVPVEDETE